MRVTRLWIVAIGALLLGTPAWALIVPPSGWTLANTDTPLVLDGVLLFRFQNELGIAPPLTPTVFDPQGAMVAGTVELIALESNASATFGIFRPSEALTEPGQYQLQGVDQFQSFTFSVLDGFLDPDAPPMNAIGTRTTQLIPLLELCCENAEHIEVGECLALRSAQAPMIFLSLAESSLNLSSRQFLYKGTLTDPLEMAPSPNWLPKSDTAFGWALAPSEQADEYCFRVDALRLTDGEVFSSEGCVPESIGELPDVLPSDDQVRSVLNVYNCPFAPPLLEQAWCEANHALCGDQANAIACQGTGYAARCVSHPPSHKSLSELAQEAAAVLDGAGDGGHGSTDAGQEDAGAMDADAGSESSSSRGASGCSAARGTHGGRASAWLTSLVLATLMLARVRARSGSEDGGT